jgi:hypothetical protein
MEETMRRTILAAAATVALLTAGAFLPSRAEAMTLAAPAGVEAAVGGVNLAQNAAYICRRVWRCGYYGCGWRRACWWSGPYWRHGYWGHPYWRHRYWRHW